MIPIFLVNDDFIIRDRLFKEVLVLAELILNEIEQWIFGLGIAIKILPELLSLSSMLDFDIPMQNLLASFEMEQIV